ncbi:MAG TPA: glycogen-debranching protein, partial [Planctomycetota bacterium]|nr:glycogen-debranching protein [Planctomycetota bacterium]
GVEGDEKLTPEILDLRKRQAKNFCALLFVSAGTPMFLAGDEFLQTQGGNNNPFNQDNETSWLDWRRLEQFPDVFRFFREMIAFRKAHPTFCRSRFWRSDIAWHGVGRHVDLSHESRSLAWCLQGKSESDSKLYVMANMYTDDLEFTIQEGRGSSWVRIVDTALPSPDDIVLEGRPVPRKKIVVRSRSVVILASREKERDAEPHA